MDNNNKKGKDLWDKLNVLGKLTSAILLAAITILLKYGIDDITVSLEKGQLVQKLLDDLTTQNQNVRQDIALIALNHSIGKHDPLLVLEIAEQVFKSRGKSDDLTNDAAFSIIQQLNPTKAKQIALSIAKDEQSNLRSDANTSPESTKRVSTDAQFVAKVFPRIVYIQFKHENSRETAKDIQKFLQQKDISAPGVERVDEKFPNSIRYFHQEDIQFAKEINRILKDFFKSNSQNIVFKLDNLSQSKFKVPTGHIEIWMNIEGG
jgi:hypothetical protein